MRSGGDKKQLIADGVQIADLAARRKRDVAESCGQKSIIHGDTSIAHVIMTLVVAKPSFSFPSCLSFPKGICFCSVRHLQFEPIRHQNHQTGTR